MDPVSVFYKNIVIKHLKCTKDCSHYSIVLAFFKLMHGLIHVFTDSFNNLVAVTSQVERYKGWTTQRLGETPREQVPGRVTSVLQEGSRDSDLISQPRACCRGHRAGKHGVEALERRGHLSWALKCACTWPGEEGWAGTSASDTQAINVSNSTDLFSKSEKFASQNKERRSIQTGVNMRHFIAYHRRNHTSFFLFVFKQRE